MNMLTKYLLCTSVLVLTGCVPNVQLETEHLTGQEYCVARDRLLPVTNCLEGGLVLKALPKPLDQQSNIKGTLRIAHEGRDYTINANEVLSIVIDGTRYPLEIINSVKSPREEVERTRIYTAGYSFSIGHVNEVTRRQISFFLPQTYLSKIIGGQTVFLELCVSSTDTASSLQDYPVVLKFNPRNVSVLQEFQARCLTNSLTK